MEKGGKKGREKGKKEKSEIESGEDTALSPTDAFCSTQRCRQSFAICCFNQNAGLGWGGGVVHAICLPHAAAVRLRQSRLHIGCLLPALPSDRETCSEYMGGKCAGSGRGDAAAPASSCLARGGGGVVPSVTLQTVRRSLLALCHKKQRHQHGLPPRRSHLTVDRDVRSGWGSSFWFLPHYQAFSVRGF